MTCVEGSYKDGDSCTSCTTGMATCKLVSDVVTALTCDNGYYFLANECILHSLANKCLTIKEVSSTKKCDTCMAGTFWNSDTCD